LPHSLTSAVLLKVVPIGRDRRGLLLGLIP
jgi:hypothetical protein